MGGNRCYKQTIDGRPAGRPRHLPDTGSEWLRPAALRGGRAAVRCRCRWELMFVIGGGDEHQVCWRFPQLAWMPSASEMMVARHVPPA